MLCVDPRYRISMDELLNHPWVLGPEMEAVLRQPPLTQLHPTVPKSPIVSYMTNVFNFIEDDIYCSVIERKMNAIAATYHLLQRRFDAGVHIVGLSMTMPSAAHTVSGKRNGELGRSWENRIEFPLLPSENAHKDDSSTMNHKGHVKTYVQLLKDSKLRSAQMVRSGNVLKQKELILRRYKTRTDMARHTKTKEEVGFLPDFVLTYTQSDLPFSHVRRPNKSFEWEQTLVISKKEPVKPEVGDNVTTKTLYGRPAAGRDASRQVNADGRVTADIPLLVPPTSPVSPFIPREEAFHKQDEPLTDINITTKSLTRQTTFDDEFSTINFKDADNNKELNESENRDTETRRVKIIDPSQSDSWSTFNKQKLRLGRGLSLLDRRSGQFPVQYGSPITRPKTLTTREARSYFEQIEHAKVIGQGQFIIAFNDSPL